MSDSFRVWLLQMALRLLCLKSRERWQNYITGESRHFFQRSRVSLFRNEMEVRMTMQRLWKNFAVMCLTIAVAACNGGSGGSNDPQTSALPDSSTTDPQNPAPSAPSAPSGSSYTTAVLIFNGTGVSTSDWQNTEAIVKSQGLSYQLVNTAEMNAMSLEELASFGVIIVPGGSGGTIAGSLTTDARIRIRQAVRDFGVGYVGFCAGAWVAVGPEADTNSTASYGFAVAKGSVLPYYWPGGNSSLVADMVDVTFADGSHRSLVWWGGPATPEWQNGVIARYETGDPAISETISGKGYVVISGPHPEAPQGWRATAGTDSDGLDYDIAIDMINAALNKQPLATF